MSLLTPEYLNHLREQLDQDEEEIAAEEMTPAVRKFCDKLFVAALKSAKEPKPPKPTRVPPGSAKVAVFRKRFESGQLLFHRDDLRWDQVKAARKVTKRSKVNGNVLEAALVDERGSGA